MARPRLLDLFCGAGGAAVGYHRAGFDVTGVDINPKLARHFPFQFIEADAMAYPLDGFDAVHASPPCQGYSVTASLHKRSYPQLLAVMRHILTNGGIPWVMENVAGARYRMVNPVRLCGSSFGLGVRRHRLFETSWPIGLAPPCAHYLQPEPVDVTGTGGPAARPASQHGGIHRKPRHLAEARAAMDIDWMNRDELSQAIPPAYTEFIGAQLLTHLAVTA